MNFNKTRIIHSALFLVSILLSACGGGATPATSTPTTSATAASDAPFTAAANPVNVTVTTDAARAASQVVTTAGATLNATSADGSQFTLVIPANAVLQDTTITMTPITGMTGLPFANGLVAAVQFAPDGLFLEKDATLTIVPASAVPVSNQTFIGYLGAGNDVHLVPPASPTAAIQMLVGHFSGMGLASGTSAERASMYLNIAADYEARLTQEMARILARERELAILGVGNGDEPSPFNLSDLFKSYYELVVRARMLAASSSCANATLALKSYLWLERQYQILGTTNPNDPNGTDWNAILKAKDATCTGGNVAGNLQFVQTDAADGSTVSGSAKVTWTLHTSGSDFTTYWPTGTFTADITRADCDTVHVTQPIGLVTPTTTDGGQLVLYNSTSTFSPNTHAFLLRSVLWNQTFQCGNPRQPVVWPNYHLWVDVGTCLTPDYPPYTDAANLTGAWACALSLGGNLFGSLNATWDFKDFK
ncbi:MAG: hypothetical protein A2V79_01980 [Betaproteobacteria bacterium RBG_16_56_24]|nr:MAG: hypothetical protein A2V79_01980 [Betaproteobacteria bacterium RBG_16_56_24]